jgi:hypothetical protein
LYYAIKYAHKYCHTLLSDIYVDVIKTYYTDENGRTNIKREETDTIWNILGASYVQEKMLNNNNSNILTMFKQLIEINGDLYIEDYDIDV